MKTFQSHKRVEAAKILGGDNLLNTGAAALLLEDAETVTVAHEWLRKNGEVADLIGGYFVRYADGYTSWSPAQAFEEGYSEVSEGAEPAVATNEACGSGVVGIHRNPAEQAEWRRSRAIDAALAMGPGDRLANVATLLDDAKQIDAFLAGEQAV